jgi:hypothetical protein
MLALPKQLAEERADRASRTGQKKFRTAVLARDGGCIITGLREPCLLDAAHIKPQRMCDEGEYDDPENGITLTATLHRAFDNRLFTIAMNGFILYPGQHALCQSEQHIDLSPEQHRYMEGHRDWFLKLCLNNYGAAII